MSDSIKHECAVTLLRLRHDTEYYVRKYGTGLYGFQKLALLLEKQHNRGQDGAGIACVHLAPEPGSPCYTMEKSIANTALADLLDKITRQINEGNQAFRSELFLGHLRYGTFGRHELSACHPFVRENSCLNRTILLAGNFNLTATRDIFQMLLKSGHHPASKADGYLILQLLAHYWEQALQRNPEGFSLPEVLRRAAVNFDGAYTLCGMTGDGMSFALRDPHGIRPGYYYFDEEVVVVASERPAIQTAFNCTTSEVQELPPGKALIIQKDGSLRIEECLPPKERKSCVFERIYFSRSNDADIHHERKALGYQLVPQILNAVGNDFDNTVFSYIPNTAQVSFHGMLDRLYEQAYQVGKRVRFGQIAIKDAKFRTFIADAACRKDFYMHIYDVTYGLVHPGTDNLVVLDDSIVRGNTMRNAILPILDRLGPKKIIVASSAPPLKYPDCYGIDMATLHELVAFEAAVELLRQRGNLALLQSCYENAKKQLLNDEFAQVNWVKPIYDEFTEEELTAAICEKLKPEGMNAELEIIYQSCDNLRKCCPAHTGDWYFTGNYPTPGGFRVVNQALLNYMEHREERAY